MCERASPKIEDCVENGQLLSQWFAERILNPENMCDWTKNNCGSLFEGGAAPAA